MSETSISFNANKCELTSKLDTSFNFIWRQDGLGNVPTYSENTIFPVMLISLSPTKCKWNIDEVISESCKQKEHIFKLVKLGENHSVTS